MAGEPKNKPSWIKPFELDAATANFEVERPAPAAPDDHEHQALAAELVVEGKRRGLFWRRLGSLGLAAAFAAIGVDTVSRLQDQIATDPMIGIPMAILLGIVAISALGLLAHELLQLRRLSRRAWLRAEGLRLVGSDLQGDSRPLISQVNAGLPSAAPILATQRTFERQDNDVLADGERLRLYERVVIEPVDRLAYRLVLESSRDIGVLTALAPYGLLDGLFVLWRTTILMRQIARLYGVAPSTATTLSLLRRCLRNSAIAGLADVASHALLEQAGASLVTLLSAKAGQGAGNALLAARLGLEAIKECRPLPFVATKQPSLGQLRKAILSDERAANILLQDDEELVRTKR
ncbi:putative membrane protein [Arboricoccus pini]|uniref:Putative membrane protein n=1 Tax=Arboricoccus pini TaxID=1963835 RepID=A0A212QZJ0_9PROT|nr:TIGR01620 family protein [Arboricoccus pini]SNB65162.1 putative membrane protein [Arboricoccus pini]